LAVAVIIHTSTKGRGYQWNIAIMPESYTGKMALHLKTAMEPGLGTSMGNCTGKMAPQLNSAMEPGLGTSMESCTGMMAPLLNTAMDPDSGG
jgi:hypothetical protein